MWWSLLFFLTFTKQTDVLGKSVLNELTLTYPQKLLLDTFWEKMNSSLTLEYMRSEIYLIRWLRDSKFNLDQAERKLLANLSWRKVNQVDDIESLDWSDFLINYPYITDVYDKDKRPTFAFSFGDWDIRRAAISGQTERLVLYWAKIMEELMGKVRQLQTEGYNVTQCNYIVDIKDYNVQQHGCTQCIPVYLGLIRILRDHYPGDVHRVHLVNAPRIFQLLMDLLRPLIGERSQTLSIYAIDRNDWRRKLYEEFSESQLPPEFGGTNFIPWDE